MPTATVARWVEVHRLAVAGREPAIARHVGGRVARLWLRKSRFADVAAIARAPLTLGPDVGAFYHLGWAQSATGQPRQALTYYEQALHLYREAGDRGNEAAALNNIGLVHHRLGDPQQALTHYHQALPTRREIGDRAGEATTLNNISVIRFQQGDLAGAKNALDEVLEITRAVGDRRSEALVSFNIAVLLSQMAQVDEAIEIQRQAITLAEHTEHPALDQMRAFLVQLEQQTNG